MRKFVRTRPAPRPTPAPAPPAPAGKHPAPQHPNGHANGGGGLRRDEHHSTLSRYWSGSEGSRGGPPAGRGGAGGALWEDPEFPPARALPDKRRQPPVLWMRPYDLCSRPTFRGLDDDGAPVDDTDEDIAARWGAEVGAAGSAGLCCAAAALAPAPRLLDRVAPPQTFATRYTGAFRFKFWVFGEWREVVVDDRLPTRGGRALYSRAALAGDFTLPLLEKAYAKLYGSYGAMRAGDSAARALQELSGGVVQSFPLALQPPALTFQVLNSAVPRSTIIVATAHHHKEKTPYGHPLPSGLVAGQPYCVAGLARVRAGAGAEAGEALVLVRAVCAGAGAGAGASAGAGAWAAHGPRWRALPPHDRDLLAARLTHHGDFWSDSEFESVFGSSSSATVAARKSTSKRKKTATTTSRSDSERESTPAPPAPLPRKKPVSKPRMSFGEFARWFSSLELVHIGPDDWVREPALRARRPWRAVLARRRWTPGYNAGGPPTNTETTSINPQFHVQVCGEAARKCHVVVSVAQQYRPGAGARALQPVGFAVYELPPGAAPRRPLSALHTLRALDVTHECAAREVATFFTLPAGQYLVVPHQRRAAPAAFLLRILTDDHTTVWEVNEDNMIIRDIAAEFMEDAQLLPAEVRAIIGKVLAKKGDDEVDAGALGAVLRRAGVRRAVVGVRAGGELCRALVALHDARMAGRVARAALPALLARLWAWRAAFAPHARPPACHPRAPAHRLRHLLAAAGLAASNKVVECVVARYAAGGWLPLGRFLVAVARLHLAHERYRALESKVKSNPLSLEEMILMTIYS